MYCIIKYYLEKDFPNVTAELLLSMFDFFSVECGISYRFIHYDMYDAIEDRSAINRYFQNNENGRKRFLRTKIVQSLEKEKRVISPYISACSDKDEFAFLGLNRLKPWCYMAIRLPDGHWPGHFEIFYRITDPHMKNALTIDRYDLLFVKMEEWGFHINNSFMHVYHRGNFRFNMSEMYTELTWLSLEGRDYIRKAEYHRLKGYRDHLFDIFFCNSLPLRLLSSEMIEDIKNIVGQEQVRIVNDSLLFSLTGKRKPFVHYRLYYEPVIRKLMHVLQDYLN